MERPILRRARVTLRRVESGGAEPHTKGIGRMSKIRFIGLDVHAGTIAIAIAEPNGEVHSVGVIPNRLESIRKAMAKLGPAKQLKACYEAGPTGYVLYWQLTQLGVGCDVIAPSLVPAKAGDRVKPIGATPRSWRDVTGMAI